MKSIVIPAPIQLTLSQPGSEQPQTVAFDLRDLIVWALDSEPAFSASAKALRQSARIEAALRALPGNSSGLLILDDEDVTVIQSAVDAPSKGYPINPARRLLPFIDAIANAKPYTPPAPATTAPTAPAVEPPAA